METCCIPAAGAAEQLDEPDEAGASDGASQVIQVFCGHSWGDAMYEALILVDPDAVITADQLAGELRRFYVDKDGQPSEIVLSGQDIALRWPGYALEVGRSCLPHVLQESAEIAEQFGRDHPAQVRIARCTCRFEISGPADPNMDHFNDSLFIGEALGRLGNVYRFDQASGEFLE